MTTLRDVALAFATGVAMAATGIAMAEGWWPLGAVGVAVIVGLLYVLLIKGGTNGTRT